MTTYTRTMDSIRLQKEQLLYQSLQSTQRLNAFHDEIMTEVFHLTLEEHTKKAGPPPCSFSLFLVGSAGRFEQGIHSDQDHGIVFSADSREAAHYFLELGKIFSDGLFKAGYPYCEGHVMSSNPSWCRSLDGWSHQIRQWLEEETLDTIRSLHILYDARVLIGDKTPVVQLKKIISTAIRHDPHMLKRFFENVQYMKKSVGLFGQIFTEQHGEHAGSLNLKQSAFLPYVNAVRVLAAKEGIDASPTTIRIKSLKHTNAHKGKLTEVEEAFQQLLDFRLLVLKNANTYEESHFVAVNTLSSSRKKELRSILKTADSLHHYVQRIVTKG